MPVYNMNRSAMDNETEDELLSKALGLTSPIPDDVLLRTMWKGSAANPSQVASAIATATAKLASFNIPTNKANCTTMRRSPSQSSIAELDAQDKAYTTTADQFLSLLENNVNGKRSLANTTPVLPTNTIVMPSQHRTSLPVLLPSPKTSNIDPDEFLVQLVTALHSDVKLKVKPASELETYFPVISEEQMARYSVEVVNMARANDVKALKQFHLEHGRDSLDCFNRFGEGLLNMACRRGFTEMVEFLLSDAVGLDVRVRDDCGRTPLHDACWNPEPQLEICTWILQKDPSLFLVADNRGFSPFQYARKSDWLIWRQFLVDNRDHLNALACPEITAKFS